jgi:hypothetical protein
MELGRSSLRPGEMRDRQVADDRVERGFREGERLCIGLSELDPRVSPPCYLDHRLRDIDSGDGCSAIRRLAGQVSRTTRNIEQPRVRSGADGVEKVIIEAVGKPGPVVVVRGGRGLPAGRLEPVERVEISQSNFPQSKEHGAVSYQYLNFSDGPRAADGRWASGPTPDGKGEFSYHEGPTTSAPMPPPTHPDSRFYGTTELPNAVEKIAGRAQDLLNTE